MPHQWAVLVGRALDGQFAARDNHSHDQPLPKRFRPNSLILALKPAKSVKVDFAARPAAQWAGRMAAAAGAHDLPEQRVVGMAAAVVDHLLMDGLGDAGDLAEQLLDGLGLQGGVTGQGGIEIVHVSLVVFAVVDFHRGLVNRHFQGVRRIRQGGQCVRMADPPRVDGQAAFCSPG